MSGRLFISYSRKTSQTGQRIRRDLQLKGISNIFFDVHPEEGIPPGSPWAQVLNREVRNADVMLVLLSRPWLESPWCRRELEWAERNRTERGRPYCIPIRLNYKFKSLAGNEVLPLNDGDFESDALERILMNKDVPVQPEGISEELERLQRLWNEAQAIRLDLSFEEIYPSKSRKRLAFYAERRKLWDSLKGVLEKHGIEPVRVPPNRSDDPYPGLEAYHEKDAAYFVGRAAEVESLVENMLEKRHNRKASNFFVVQGASGSGKSSVLRAGLLSRLKLAHRDEFYCLPTVRPGINPITRVRSEGLQSCLIKAFDLNTNYPSRLYDHKIGNKQLPMFPGLAKWQRENLQTAEGKQNFAVDVKRALEKCLTEYDAGLAELEKLLARLASVVSNEEQASEETPDGESPQLQRTLLLSVDQAEELFPAESELDRRAPDQQNQIMVFRRLLSDLIKRRTVDLVVVFSIRSDSYPRLQESLEFQESEGTGVFDIAPFNLSPLPVSAYEAVIREPARLVGLEVEDKLVLKLLGDLSREGEASGLDWDWADGASENDDEEGARVETKGRADALPLLAFTLKEMYCDYDANPGVFETLSLELYKKQGGIDEILDKIINSKLQKLTIAPDTLQRMFVGKLATVDPASGQFLRRIARLSEFPAVPEGTASCQKIAKVLRDEARILTVHDASEEYEVSHEAVLRQWTPLKEWLTNARLSLATIQEARNAAKIWAQELQKLEESGAATSLDRVNLSADKLWVQERIDAVWDAFRRIGDEKPEDDLLEFLRPEAQRSLGDLSVEELPHERRAAIGDRLESLGRIEVDNKKIQLGDMRRGVNVHTAKRISVWTQELEDSLASRLDNQDREATLDELRRLGLWREALERGRLVASDLIPVLPDGPALPDITWSKVRPGNVRVYLDEGALKDWAKAGAQGDIPESAGPVSIAIRSNIWIARYPITLAQFRLFSGPGDEGSAIYNDPRWWDGFPPEIEAAGKPIQDQRTPGNYPAQYLTWYQGVAYCRWLTHLMREVGGIARNAVIRLPTEAEWVMAATGGDGRRYPWGSDWDPTKCSNGDKGGINRFVAVGLYPQNAAPQNGPLDMSGNLYEWCLNKYDDLGDFEPFPEASRATKGGAYFTQGMNLPVSHALSVHHRFKDRPYGLTGDRDNDRSTRIAAGIRPVLEAPPQE